MVFGANQLAFLCDDAYIHFRYAANAHAGHGLVWNAAPFEPVEGYGFLWVVTLWGVWSWFGVEPPAAANVLSFGFGVVQLLLLAVAVPRLTGRNGNKLPMAIGLAALLIIVGNRTFLQWLSSGLDTALFNMWLLWWVLHACRGPGQRTGTWIAVWSTAAALAALTRPDGLPLVCATLGVVAWLVLRRRAPLRSGLLGLSPLLAVAAHVLWRRSYYGEWLPNTYFAKVVSAWPEAGWRYFACFALENGAWLWFPLAAVWLVVELRAPLRAIIAALADRVPGLAAVAIVLFNACYYLFKVGGDHFEYRVLSQLVPLGVLACVAMAMRIGGNWRLPLATVVSLGMASSVGWVHLALTSDARAEGIKAVTPQLPAVVRPLSRWFDRQQVWLFFRYIGLRCNHHAARFESLRVRFPRRQSLGEAAGALPIRAESAIGLPGWCLPDCNFLDVYGLNDWVVARTPVVTMPEVALIALERHVHEADGNGDGLLEREELRTALGNALGVKPDDGYGLFVLRLFWDIYCDDGSERVTLAEAVEIGSTISFSRRMAHERSPPPGYVEAFDQNVDIDVQGVVTVRPRAVPLTDERVRTIEAEWRTKVRRNLNGN